MNSEKEYEIDFFKKPKQKFNFIRKITKYIGDIVIAGFLIIILCSFVKGLNTTLDIDYLLKMICLICYSGSGILFLNGFFKFQDYINRECELSFSIKYFMCSFLLFFLPTMINVSTTTTMSSVS
jgi:hypothetical protein